MINVIDLLKENKEVSNFKVNRLNKETYELFFVHDNLETVRATETKQTSVTVYVNHKKFTGDYTFTQEVNDSKEVLIDKINNAISNAMLINNKVYTLPLEDTTDATIESNFTDYSYKDLATKIYNVLKNCVAKSKAKLNATEIFLYKKIREVENSQGLKKKETSYECMIETIPTYDISKTKSVELYECFSFSNFDEKNIETEIMQSLKDVTSRARAKKPDYKINCPVLLRAKELNEIVRNITNELNYSSLYSNVNLYNKGQNIQDGALYDTFDIKALGQIEGATNSRLFDQDGVSLDSQKLVTKGVIKNFYGSNQYAQYVHKKATGNLPLLEVKKGSYSERTLKSEPYLECVSFSGLQVDIASDYIGGEVRLANYFDGNKVHPVTGISISAKFSDVLKTLKLSKKIVVKEDYKGPNLALLSNFNIF
jgi:PmbA protein